MTGLTDRSGGKTNRDCGGGKERERIRTKVGEEDGEKRGWEEGEHSIVLNIGPHAFFGLSRDQTGIGIFEDTFAVPIP